MSYDSKLEELKEKITNIEYIKYTLNSMIYWDKITYMPDNAIEYRSKTMAFLAEEQYKMLKDDKFTALVQFFEGNKRNNIQTDATVNRIERSAKYIRKIPEDEYREYIKLIAVSEQVWQQANMKNNFEIFKPYLKKIIDSFKSFAEHWGYEEDPYDALLGYYEEGLTVKEMDAVVETVKEELMSLLEKIDNSKKTDTSKGTHSELIKTIGPVDEYRQKKVWEIILKQIGFDFKSGRVDIGSHATILANSPYDVRIVNSYDEADIRTGIFNTLHAGGKGIYQQSIDPALLGTFLCEAPSFATEEAIGRLYENIIGRRYSFWERVFPEILEIIPELEGLAHDGKSPLDVFYEEINDYKSTLIRVNADELTYLLHVIIRYEIERELITGNLSVDDLKQEWNKKYEEYLGIAPAKDREGVLQDIHWAAGYVGYFPSYFISNLAAAQLAAKIGEECGSMDRLIEEGHFDVINGWLTDNFYKYGSIYSFSQLINMATGDSINPKHYMEYLETKISLVYN